MQYTIYCICIKHYHKNTAFSDTNSKPEYDGKIDKQHIYIKTLQPQLFFRGLKGF